MAKDTRPGGLPFALPCAMEEFAAAQERHCRDFAATLRNDWRTAFAEQIVDNIQDVFDFFQSNAAVFEAGPLRRLLTHFELRMTNQLREVLLNSLDDWVGFIRRFTAQAADDAALEVPKLDSLEGASTPPLFRVMLQVSFPETERTSAPRIPRVTIEPSHEEMEEALLARVDQPVAAIRELSCVDADLMSLLHLPERRLLDVGCGNALVADVDARLDGARAEIRRLLDGALKAPQALAAKYGEFAWISAVETTSHVRSFVRRDPPPSRAEYVEEVKRFHDAAIAVENLSENDERFTLCSVDTTAAKAALANKAREVRMALLQHVIHDARVENEQTIARYEEILARLAEHPANEAELAALKEFIANSRIEVLQMVDKVEEMHARIATFDEYCIPLSKEDTFLAWSTMEYPKRVADASNETEMRIEMDKVRMMDKLAIEKNQFDEMLQQFEVDVRRAKQYSDYASEQSYVEEINGLQDAITEGV